MHTSRLDLNLLRVLEAVATAGTITGAAEKLNLTQPAISHALNRLREQLGDPLFTREGRGLLPSTYTQEILPELRSVMNDLEHVLAPRVNFDAQRSNLTFNLAIHEAMEPVILPLLMQRLQEQAPNVTIQSIKLDRRQVEKELRAGKVDMVSDILLPVGEAIDFKLMRQMPMVVVAREGHSRIRGELTMDDYLRERHVLVSSRRRGQGYEDQQLAGLEHRRIISLRLRDFQVACRVVAGTDLLLTLPQNYAHQMSFNLGLQILSPPFELPPVSAYLYWFSVRGESPSLRWLRTLLLSLSDEV